MLPVQNAALPVPGYLLIVEDNPGEARLIDMMLSELGDVSLPPLRWVQTASAAFAMLACEPPCTAVLLDLGLPDSQGLETLLALTRRHSRVPVIVLTGDQNDAIGSAAVAAGAQDFLLKGHFNAAALLRCITFASQRKQTELALLDRSRLDDLTGMPMRAILLDRLHIAIANASRTPTLSALLFIDLDLFKRVNDTHGHTAGDAVLCAVAQRISAAVRASDTAARMGGDEFAVLLGNLAHLDDAMSIGRAILTAISEPVVFEGHTLQVSASIGVAHFHGGAESAEQLLARADAAMYASKTAGKGRVSWL